MCGVVWCDTLCGLRVRVLHMPWSWLSSCRFEPRFLLFEFMSLFLLRKRQCELVQGFAHSARNRA